MAIASDAGGVFGARLSTPRPAKPAASDEQLRDCLRSIADSVASPEDALDPMVRAVIEAVGACAGAVCLFDVRERMLRLAAEVGLSDEGCRRLRSVRKGEADAWEMPLHGLVNGRAYLIENASRNRFVPPLIEDASEMSAVVCLPLSSGDTPLASLILVALKPRTFDERRLHAIEGPLQEMVRVIEATRRHAEGRGRVSASTPSPTEGHGASAPQKGGHASETTGLTAKLAPAEHERTRLAAALEAARAGDGARVADLRGEIDRLRAQLGEAEAGAAHERRAREELETRFVGGASAGRQELQRAQEALQESESARASAVAETARLRAEFEIARMEAAHQPVPAVEVDARITELLAQTDQLRASLAQAEAGAAHEQRAREELESRLAGGNDAGQHELRQTVAAARAAEQARAAAIAEVSRLRNELELVRIEATPGPSGPGQRDDRIGPILAEIDRLRARLAEAEAGAAHEHRARDELETRFTQGVATGQQELRQALMAARRAEEARATTLADMGRLRAELERARSDAARAPGPTDEVDARVVELAVEIDRLRTRVAEAEAGAAHQHQAREELEARLTGDGNAGQRELRKAIERARHAEQARATATAEAARLGAELERARLMAVQTPEHVAEVAARSAEQVAEIDRLHTKLAQAEAGAAHEHRAREEFEARLTRATTGAHEDLQRVRVAARSAEDARGTAEAEVVRLGAELRQARAEAARLPELRSAAERVDLQALHETHAADVVSLTARCDELTSEIHSLQDVHATLGSDRDRLAAELEGTAAAKAHLERSFQQAGEASRGREQAAIARAQDFALQLAARDAELNALAEQRAAEVAERDARVDALVAEADGLRECVAAVGTERDRLAADLQGAAAGKVHLEQALERALEDARGSSHELRDARGQVWALSVRLGETETRYAASREEHATENATLTGRVQTLTAAVDQLREAHAAAGATCDRLAADVQGSAAAKAHLEEALQAALDEARTRDQEAMEQLDEARAQVWITAARLTEIEQRLIALGEERAAEAGAFAARVETLESETDRWRAGAAATDTERDRLAADLEGAAAAKAHLEETLKAVLETARSREQDTTALLQEVRGQAWATAVRLTETDITLRAVCEERTAEVAALAARTQALMADTERMREAESAATSERDHLAAELVGARAAHERLEQTLAQTLAESSDREEALAAQLTEREREVVTLRADHPPEATKPAVETGASGMGNGEGATPAVEESARLVAQPEPLRSASSTVPPAESAVDLVAVLDDEGAWSGVTIEQRQTMILAPDAAGVAQLASARPGHVVVNLAASGAMKTLVAGRALGARTRLCGYLAKAGSDGALPIGAVEPAVRPLAPDAIVATLTPRMPVRARVVTVGADVDAMLSLRQALGRQGASVSLAWDAKQATDLLDMVHPHVVVIDLEMARDACIVLARLVASQPMPIVVLIEGPASSGAELATVLGNPEVASQLVSRKDLLGAVLRRAGSAPSKAARPVGATPARSAGR